MDSISYPDRITRPVLAGIERSVSAEIAASVVTTALLDGTARQRRDLRILARRLNGITAVHGVTLEQAIAHAKQDDRPVVVALDIADVIVPVAVDAADKVVATTEQDAPVAATSVAAAAAVAHDPVDKCSDQKERAYDGDQSPEASH